MSRNMDGVDSNKVSNQRRRAVKTAWLLAAVALLIFFAFILSGVLKA